MATIGRKNVHGKGGVRFKAGYTSDKEKNMLRNVVSQLIISGHVEVTLPVAKRVSAEADRLVTYAKKGDLAARRLLIQRLIRLLYKNYLMNMVLNIKIETADIHQ